METVILSRTENCSLRQLLRSMDQDTWINNHGSGTLRKNKSLGMSWRSQYLHERVAWDFGHVFELLPRSRVTFGDAITEGDCKPITEAGWYIERYFTLNKAIFPSDYYECKYITAERADGTVIEGIGIIVRETSAPWLPAGHVLFGIVAPFSKILNKWLPAQNPL